LPDGWAPYLSAATRQATDEKKDLGTITCDNWRQIATPHQERTVSAKIAMILEFYAKKCAVPGRGFSIAPAHDYPLFDCVDEAEYNQYLRYLVDRKLLEQNGNALHPTIEGFQEVEPRVRAGGEPDRCFVAMWFDDDLDQAWERGIEPAVRDCGFKPYR